MDKQSFQIYNKKDVEKIEHLILWKKDVVVFLGDKYIAKQESPQKFPFWAINFLTIDWNSWKTTTMRVVLLKFQIIWNTGAVIYRCKKGLQLKSCDLKAPGNASMERGAVSVWVPGSWNDNKRVPLEFVWKFVHLQRFNLATEFNGQAKTTPNKPAPSTVTADLKIWWMMRSQENDFCQHNKELEQCVST